MGPYSRQQYDSKVTIWKEEKNTGHIKMNHKYNYNQCHSYTFICLILFLALGILSNMHEVVATSDIDSSGKGHITTDADLLDKGDFAEFFDFGTGAFAAYSLVYHILDCL